MKPYNDHFSTKKPTIGKDDYHYDEDDSDGFVLPSRDPFVPYDIVRKSINRTSDPQFYDSAKKKNGNKYINDEYVCKLD